MLSIKGLKKYFGGVRAVDGVSFEIEEGEFTAVIGPNGSGKTTLFNLIIGFLSPDEGEITFKGKDITGKSPHQISGEGITKVHQISSGLKELSILENVMLGFANQKGESIKSIFLEESSVSDEQQKLKQKSLELLKDMKLEKYADELPSSLDAGALRKVELLRAMAFDPELLLLDEPLSGVSPEGMSEVSEILINLNKKREKTLLLVEHNVRKILKIVERVIVLHQGKIIADGTPSEIKGDKEVIEVYLGGDYGKNI
ncbi:hypothetical protein AKJ36_00855 [candidate division MSBL1 archaeon SCGC-AAA259I07]|uniref:Probable branched-chain amino acid transport ATP-binding protein LivG n=1 Tax=candidate division MSBL1 archaeon SCGC-AAA259I07 TaxID=1698266 RepID=A0A133UMJ5_9EURY|nr:hypothetical protein AKJ36_00855 [candidate division MSBL1 archaeon SCGC-AAA259I07]